MASLQERFLDWFPRVVPWKLMAPLVLPTAWQLKTRWHIPYENARMIETSFGFVHNNGVEGDYLEFGVYRGRTFAEAWRASRRYQMRDMRFHAFDSFQGLPMLEREDGGGGFYEGQFRCDRATFERNLGRQKIDLTRVGIHAGAFDETLREPNCLRDMGIDRAAIVWIDCDLYSSTVAVLRALTGVLRNGTVLIFDDWYCYQGRPDQGEQRACAEWLATNPAIRLVEYHKFHWAGASFIVNVDR